MRRWGAVLAAGLALAVPVRAAWAGSNAVSDPVADNTPARDPRGDILAAGGGGVRVDIHLTTVVRTFDDPTTSPNWVGFTTGVIWFVDTNLDGNEDFDVYYLHNRAELVSFVTPPGQQGTVLCKATPAFDAATRTYISVVPRSCLGNPHFMDVVAFMGYQTATTQSSDISPVVRVDTDTHPIGALDRVTRTPGSVRVQGWALDLDVPGSIPVHAYVGSTGVAATANLSRPDVASAFPGYGDLHGFDISVPVSGPGPRTLCVYLLNAGPGPANVELRCSAVATRPFGVIDLIRQRPEGIEVSGWAIDPDVASPISVHLYDGPTGLAAVFANGSRPDIGAAFPGYGNPHGFTTTLPVLAPGGHTLCAFGIDAQAGSDNSLLGCRGFTVLDSPFGFVDVAQRQSATSVRVAGWGIDPDTSASILVHVYSVDAAGNLTFAGQLPADAGRSDIGSAFPGYGNAHGFDEAMTVPASATQVCAYGIDVAGPGANALLGCRAV